MSSEDAKRRHNLLFSFLDSTKLEVQDSNGPYCVRAAPTQTEDVTLGHVELLCSVVYNIR